MVKKQEACHLVEGCGTDEKVLGGKVSVAEEKTVAVQPVPDGHPGNAEYLGRHGFIAPGLCQSLEQLLFFLFVGGNGGWKGGGRRGKIRRQMLWFDRPIGAGYKGVGKGAF